MNNVRVDIAPIFINGEWRPSKHILSIFHPVDPSTGEDIEKYYPVSGFEDIKAALRAGRKAAAQLAGENPERIADFFDHYARNIENRCDELVETAAKETGLPKQPRLRDIELPRTTDQLRQAGAAVRDRSWRMAVIDTAKNLRTQYRALGGPVAVFGPNNFPFAFNSAAGGDFAAALAAGNPVIAKAHPAHPETTAIFTQAASEALEEAGLPGASVQMFYHMTQEDGFKLVSHPLIAASAFTGSRASGLALKHAAQQAGKLIYLEMSGINPVFILPGALKERADEIAEELCTSCNLGAGQFCTNPGLIVLLDSPESQNFLTKVSGRFNRVSPGFILSPQGLQTLDEEVKSLLSYGALLLTGGKILEGEGLRYAPTLLSVEGHLFLKYAQAFQQEAFGPSTLVIKAESEAQLLKIAGVLEGNLTGTIYSHSEKNDDKLYNKLEPVLRTKVGRLINDNMPTGVAVSPAMFHGGPYPASGHPGFSSVGIPRSILRFASLQCYDRVRSHRLPVELQNPNPTGSMWRYIDGKWTQADIRDPDAGESFSL